MLNLVQGTVETVNVTITDTSGVLSTLNSMSPTYSVVPYDSVNGVDQSFYYAKYSWKQALNSGMMIQCLIDTTQTFPTNTIEAANAPVLPVTIVAGTNDTWKVGATSFIMPAGVYATVAALAAAMDNSLTGVTPLYASPWGLGAIATVNGKIGLYADPFILGYNGADAYVINNGAVHNALPSLGFTNGQAFKVAGSTSDGALWATGRYSLYVNFINAGANEKPFLGPIPVFVNVA